jgi:ATP-dependent Clp protease protease subunit
VEHDELGTEGLLKDPELRPLAKELLAEQVRTQRANADLAERKVTEADIEARDRNARNSSVRHLPITDAITSDHVDAWIAALEHWERRDPGQPITITIRSPGGDVGAGLALYDTILRLRRKGHHVTTRGSGYVMSMAVVLLQAGDERILDERAKVMIHEGSRVYSEGARISAAEEEDMRKLTEMLREDILSALADRSNMSKRQISTKWKRRDWYLTAADSVKYGFADRVE